MKSKNKKIIEFIERKKIKDTFGELELMWN